jgi:hypothetical protein
MNKLDYIDMKLDGNGTLPDIFKELGKIDFSEEISELSNDNSDVEMKATSVRLPVSLLNSYDAVLKRFEVSRQDTFAYMVHDFIAQSISSYVQGRVKQMIDSGIKFDDGNLHKAHLDEYSSFIDSIPASDEVKGHIKHIAYTQIMKSMEDY